MDTLWVGGPGEPVPTGVTIRIRDMHAEPVAGAMVTWEAVGRNSVVVTGSLESDAKGLATAVWQLGTDAAETQELHVLVRRGQEHGELTVRARAVPHVVAQLRVSVDTPAVLRVGDSLPVAVTAIDPFGNTFPAPPARLSLSDTTMGKVAGSVVIGGPRRGATELTVISDYVTSRVPLHVVQYVAAIIPAVDTLTFRSLGAAIPIAYRVRDDRGRVVGDTIATLSVADTSVAQVTDTIVRASQPGATELRLAVGSVTSTVAIAVEQRVASLALRRDTIRFDALHDTTTIYAIARDSLGYPVLNPDLVLQVANDQVVTLSPDRSLEAVTPGITVLTLRDAVTGLTATAPVVVQQRVARIDVAPITFDALGDTIPIAAVARDRLGSVVAGASLTYSISDSAVVRDEPGQRVRSAAEGRTVLTVTDPESGTVGTADVMVAQRVRTLTLNADSLGYDALGDSTPVSFDARDRLGAGVRSAVVSYSSTDAGVASVDAGGIIRTRNNGTTLIIGASQDGPADTVRVSVAQIVSAILTDSDSLVLESLHAQQDVHATAVDRLGSPVTIAGLTFTTDDGAVATIGSGGQVMAVGNGATTIIVSSSNVTYRVGVRVAQRPVKVKLSADTVRFTAFGDSVHLTAVAVDSLGTPVAGNISGIDLNDTSLVSLSSETVTARGNGQTTATISVLGLNATVVIAVNQIATTLSAQSTFGNQVVTLPIGAVIPLDCQAFDRNSFAIARIPVLVGSARGTVEGTSCVNAHAARSGYDTVTFALDGVQTRLAIIVATSPDSVGVIAAAESLPSTDRIRYAGEDLANPSILALRPLVDEILSEYGNPSTGIDRARALRDWVARTAVHPHPPLHPDGSTANLGVLPPGKTWFDVNSIIYRQANPDSMTQASNAYWQSIGYDGYAMLDRLLGTLDPVTGVRADDGMMVHLGGAHYQIRDLQSFHYPICTFQAIMLSALWSAAGLQGMLASTIDHDPVAVFIPDLNKWVYEDPTFNEEYELDGVGDPLSPTELLNYSSAGQAGRLQSRKMPGPSVDPEPYIGSESYLSEHSNGMVIMGSQLNNHVVGIGGWNTRLVQIDVPALATAPLPYSNSTSYVRVTPQDAFPTLGPVIDHLDTQDSVFVIQLSSTFPNHARFERRLPGGPWQDVLSTDLLPVGQCKVEYRSVDSRGNYSATTIVDVWAPRGETFLLEAGGGTTRSQSVYCVSPS